MDGELGEPEHSQVCTHIEDCSECAHTLSEETTLRRLLKSSLADDCEAPPHLERQLRGWVRMQSQDGHAGVRSNASRSQRVVVAGFVGLAAAILLVIAFGRRDYTTPVPGPETVVESERTIRTANLRKVRVVEPTVGAVTTRKLQRVERIQLSDGPGLLFTFMDEGEVVHMIQTRNGTFELNTMAPANLTGTFVPSRDDATRTWVPPQGPMTVATFPSPSR
tara:strand:- start:455 stop:1117 length:663 start_codon:yes stop_codon:yes gene_type:complete